MVSAGSPSSPLPAARGGGGVVVELIDGEDGVAPGQACVLYDASDGQARVLGGGFIKSTLAMTQSPNAAFPEPVQASQAN